jgi:hypothetical protein
MLDDFKKMFEGDNTFLRKLEYLETSLAFLPDLDQRTVLGLRLIFDTGGALPPNSEQHLNRMLGFLSQIGNNITAQEAPLSLARVVTDLRKVQLSPTEQRVLDALEPKILARQPLTLQETDALLKVYGNKGF